MGRGSLRCADSGYVPLEDADSSQAQPYPEAWEMLECLWNQVD